MALLNRIKNLFVQDSTYRTPHDFLFKSSTFGQKSDSGEVVTETTAMSLAWVWQAVSTISNDIGRLPVVLFDRSNGERERATTHPAYQLIKRRPNPYMTSKVFMSTLTKSALLTGNGLAWIMRDQRGIPIELYPLDTSTVRINVIDNEPVYLVRFKAGDEETAIRYRDIIHIKNISNNGYWGLDCITYGRNSIGLGLATEKHGNRFFKNNARPSVVLETAGNMDKERADQLLASWNEMHAGANNAYKTALLTGGMEAKVMSINNDNAQWLQSRQFQRQEIASWFLLPANKLNDTASVSYASVAAYNKAYLDQTLMNWIVTWEEELTDKLLTTRQREDDQFSFEFITASLLRADLLQRYQAYQVGIASEFLSPNEVRRLENMPAREGGDSFVNPNTKSGDSPQPEPVPEDAAARTDMEPSLRALLADRMGRMIRLEVTKAKQAANREANFISWLELFYDTFGEKVEEALRPCVTTAQAAGFADGCDVHELTQTHIMDSIDRLLNACECKPEELETKIVAEVSTWDVRADEIINRIMEKS